MRRITCLVFLFLLLSGVGFCQPSQSTHITPDCILYFPNVASVTNSINFDNRTLGCNAWAISYSTQQVSAFSFTFQGAADAGGTPGTWGTFPGTVVTGSFTFTTLNYANGTYTGYAPWVRLSMTAFTGSNGTVSAVLLGWRTYPQNNNISVTNLQCSNSTPIAVSTSGLTQIIPQNGSTQIKVCHISLAVNNEIPENVSIVQGTGSNCGTSTATVGGIYYSISAMALDFASPLTLSSGTALCINLGTSTLVGGVIVYGQN